MHIDLIRSSSKSLPHQISETLSQRISSGLLQQGARLPSVRSLATALRVSQVTVSKAYDVLEKRGLIYCRQGKGCFVADPEHTRRQADGRWQDMMIIYRELSFGAILITLKLSIPFISLQFIVSYFL